MSIEAKVEIHADEYDGQTLAELDGKRYRITRTYTKRDETKLELTLSDLAEGGG